MVSRFGRSHRADRSGARTAETPGELERHMSGVTDQPFLQGEGRGIGACCFCHRFFDPPLVLFVQIRNACEKVPLHACFMAKKEGRTGCFLIKDRQRLVLATKRPSVAFHGRNAEKLAVLRRADRGPVEFDSR